jgi:hypothetical protein
MRLGLFVSRTRFTSMNRGFHLFFSLSFLTYLEDAYKPKCPSVRKREIVEQIDSNHATSILETKQPKVWAVHILLLYY